MSKTKATTKAKTMKAADRDTSKPVAAPAPKPAPTKAGAVATKTPKPKPTREERNRKTRRKIAGFIRLFARMTYLADGLCSGSHPDIDLDGSDREHLKHLADDAMQCATDFATVLGHAD